MEHDDPDRSRVVLETYFDRFGEEGDFDRWIFGGDVNIGLMAMALKRGSPVTETDLETKHQELYKRPLGDPPPEGTVT
jgi:hypothetical protein